MTSPLDNGNRWAVLGVTVFFLSLGALIAQQTPALALVNESPSVPRGLYLRQPGSAPSRGAMVALPQPPIARRYLGALGMPAGLCGFRSGLLSRAHGRARRPELPRVPVAGARPMIPATEPVVPASEAADEDLLTRKEASAFLVQYGIRMKPETLARLWSTGGNGPPCLHVRHRPYYPRGVLRA